MAATQDNSTDGTMVGDTIKFNGKTWTIEKLLGKGKAAYSWLIQHGDQKLVYKKMHQEPVEHYTFGNKARAEVEAYEKLEKARVPVPKLRHWDDEEQYLIKDYVDGPVAIEMAARGELKDTHWDAILRSHSFLKTAGLHVDFFPSNFLYLGGQMLLIDYECHPYNQEWDFPNWGMFYWLNTKALRELLDTGSSDTLSLPGRPKPTWEPFIEKRDDILARLGYEPCPPPESVWTC